MIFLGIGSNLSSEFGDRFKNIELAISFLQKIAIKIIKKSSYYESFSYPNKNDPKFINIIISVETDLEPMALMRNLILIEEKLGRKRNKKNDPRTCDIDIIDYHKKVLQFKKNDLELTIPHKGAVFRNFVLFPLREICPDWKHPVTKKNIDILINELNINNNEITKLS